MKFNALTFFVASSALLFLSACASGPKANISSTSDPSNTIAQMESEISEGYRNQYDVLVPEMFSSAQSYLKEAKEDLSDGDDREDVMENLAYARGHLNKAKEQVRQRSANAESLLNAREAALTKGIRGNDKLEKKLKSLDERFRTNSDRLGMMTPGELNALQQGYLDLEKNAVQNRELSSARRKIDWAISEGARSQAPKTLARAQKDMKTAENVIASNVRNEAAYKNAVSEANTSAELLYQVEDVVHTNGKILPEDVALDIVAKNQRLNEMDRRVGSLSQELGKTRSELSTVSAKAAMTDEELAKKEKTLKDKEMALKMEQAIEEVSQQFPKDQAEVYQNGDKVVIRLKGGFPFGKSEIKEDAKPLLEKVGEVAKNLNAKEVVVEGHTDSIGDQAVNERLSEDRAKAVAAFLSNEEGVMKDKIEAKGYGFNKPLATNKTKEGRAQNRRVDVIISTGDSMDQ